MLNKTFFDAPMSFESDLVNLLNQVTSMEEAAGKDEAISKQIEVLKAELYKKTEQLYANLRAIDRVEIARHPNRPRSLDYINRLCTDFFELAGDRRFGEDKAMVCGLANFNNRKIMLIAQEKGNNETRKLYNYGSCMPEGYRKAERAMRLAEELQIPIVTFVDTPGAYHGPVSEERGQAHALAECISTMSQVKVPVIACILGEGGSGGAIAIATGNEVIIMENAVYSVITPEGCASILWQMKDKKAEAAEAQKLTSRHLLGYKIVDRVVKEPFGGAHRDPEAAIEALGKELEANLAKYAEPTQYLRYMQERADRYRQNPRMDTLSG